MSDALKGLDAVEWHSLGGAYGSADNWAGLLRAASTGASAAWDRLWGTVWHQGTVYEATAAAVPFLVEMAIRGDGDESGRSQAGFLLGSIAAATSFVLPGQPAQMVVADWLRTPGTPLPERDLVHECNAAVAVHAVPLANALGDASPEVRAGLLAALAAVGSTLPQSGREALVPLTKDPDAHIRVAASLTLGLATGTHSSELMAVAAELYGNADNLETLNNWPEGVRVVEMVRGLCWGVGL